MRQSPRPPPLPPTATPDRTAVATGSFPKRESLGSWECSRSTRRPADGRACLHVKPVRELDDRDGHVQFDERGGETERWASRRERQRKASLVLGAAGPVRHRATPRLYRVFQGAVGAFW